MQSFEAIPFAPGGEGLLGHNSDFRGDRLALLRRLAEERAPILRLRLPFPGVRAAVVHDPDTVQELLVERGRAFDKSDMLRFGLYPLAGEGLFTSNGELWRRQRKLMAPLFQPKVLETYASDMIACTHRTIDRWQDGIELPIAHETTRLTMSIAGKTLFDADTFTEADAIGHALTIALDFTGWIVGRPLAVAHVMARRKLEDLPSVPAIAAPAVAAAIARLTGPSVLMGRRGRELAQAIALLDDHVQRMIDDRRRVGCDEHPDLLSRLLSARDEDGTGERMSDRQVRDEVLTLFVAGHETTATGLAWSLYLLGRHPEIRAAVEREVDAVGDSPTVADLPHLPLCLRVFREALRLYPPVYLFGRDANEDTQLAGYALPRRTNVIVSPWALHHAPHLWSDPERFDPDRFLPERESERHRYAYLPFGAGPRVCIGQLFAYMEAQLALAVMLRRFRVHPLGEDVPDVSGTTLRPKHGIRARLELR